jgi:hypothetical protein
MFYVDKKQKRLCGWKFRKIAILYGMTTLQIIQGDFIYHLLLLFII